MKYKITFADWNTGREITADGDFAGVIFEALCDWYGIDSDEIETEYDNDGMHRAYVKDDDGDLVVLIARQ